MFLPGLINAQDVRQEWIRYYRDAWYGSWGIALNTDSQSNIYVAVFNYDYIPEKMSSIIKYDTDGNELWVRKPGGGINSLFVDQSDNVYVTGKVYGVPLYTSKYDINGNELWRSALGNAYDFYRSTPMVVADSLENAYVALNFNLALVKYDKNGNALWYNSPGAGNYHIAPPAINITNPIKKDYLISETLTIDFTVFDATSGVNSFSAILDNQNVATGQTINLYELSPGSHTFTVIAEDMAGNKSIESVTFNIVVTTNSLIDLIRTFFSMGLIDNQGIADSLIEKVEDGTIKAFLNQLYAQDGKHIDSWAAEILRIAIAFI